MATRLEKLEERLDKEQRRLDLKRIRHARDYMRLAITALKDEFHHPASENHIRSLTPSIAETAKELTTIIENEG